MSAVFQDLQHRITSIFDYAYTSTSIRLPSVTCAEVGKLLHVGMFIEEMEKQRPAFQFSSSDLSKLDGNATDASVRAAKKVRETYKKMNQKWRLYSDAIKFTDQEIGFIVGRLSGLEISDPKRDVFGDALEIFRSKWAKQEGGQFFTDQLVTHMAIRMLQFDPYKGDDLVDICSGTGGFLLAGLNRIKELADAAKDTEEKVAGFAAKALKGKEIDAEVSSLGNAALTSRTGTLAEKIIEQGNSLDLKAYGARSARIRLDSHRCIATNPPFGAKTPVRDEKILSQYELSRTNGSSQDSLVFMPKKYFRRSPDVLFLEANVKLLIPGEGRMAIVTPYQVLSGPQTYYIRDWLLRNCHVEAVIDLPMETFQPHTGTKTALLVVRRREKPLLEVGQAGDESIFMAVPRWIGHDRRGNPVWAKNPDGTMSNERLTDFPEVEAAYQEFIASGAVSKSYEQCFVVSVATVVGDNLLRLNAQSYKPVAQTAVASKKPKKSGWTSVRLGDVVERVFYPGRFKREYTDRYDGAVPFLGGSNITEFISSTEKWLRHDDPKLPDLAVRKGWLLITRSGTTGIISCVPESWDGFAVSEHVIRIVPNPSKLNPDYLLAYLKTRHCQAALKRGVFGSVIDEISPEFVATLEIPIPPSDGLGRITALINAAESNRSAAIRDGKAAVDELTLLLNS